jgi:hydrogenase-4 component F
MNHELSLWLLIMIPAISGLICLILPSIRTAIRTMCAGVFITGMVGIYQIRTVFTTGAIFASSGWLFSDALSAYHLSIMLLIYGLSSAYAWIYLGEELRQKQLTLAQSRIFACLWCESLAAMTIVLLSNNLGIMWVGIEATTLITSFLICIHRSRESMEAMWKYILICSVGVAFAFLGTLLAAASDKSIAMRTHDALLWTTMRDHAAHLDPVLIKAAFIFLLVGYGTKAGLAPMHNWLPDAHSQSPSPVSAIFSGFMLNAAMYCIMRYIPIVETATGNIGWSLNLMSGFGIFSMIVAGAFILFQTDLKRLLAYCSIEHIGIISLGLGIGGIGVFAALFHTLNHSLCKSLSFFAAGRLGQIFDSHDMSKMAGSVRVSPVWGIGLFGSILALIGIAPFALFMSEFQLLKAAVDSKSIVSLILFLISVGIVFVGMLRHAIPMAWGSPDASVSLTRSSLFETVLVVMPLGILLLLGLWMPKPLYAALNEASNIIRNIGVVIW